MARATLPAAYRLAGASPGPFLDEADRRAAAKDIPGAVRALSGLVERAADRGRAAQLVAYRLLALGEAAPAVRMLLAQAAGDPQDPATHRALAAALRQAGRPAWAALHYEAALARLQNQGNWFRAVRAEYADLLAGAARDGRLRVELRDHFAVRLRELGTQPAAGLRVSVTWNSSASEVELDVTGPDGHRVEPKAGRLAGDRQGPRVYEVENPAEGAYRIEARLARTSPAAPPETYASVVVVRHAGTPRERRERHVILLRKAGESRKVGELRTAPDGAEASEGK